uniref:GNAT family N-acetyltransferase n=1 Tax=Acetatifactor sp. TaxID=1872090 RepID=UPI004055CD82
MHITYKLAQPQDLDEISTLVQNAISTMIQQNILQWDEIYPTKEVFQEDITRKQLYVGTIKNQIAVIYVLNQECDDAYKDGKWKEPSKSYYVIHRLCVNPAFQNRGVGTATLLHIEEELQAMGIEAIRLDAFTQNPYSLKMYDKLGYSKVGYADWRKGRFYLMEKYLE